MEDTSTTPVPPSTVDSLPPPLSMETKPESSVLADYEELPDVVSPITRSMTMSAETKPFQVTRQSVVENEYVPSPENSPKLGNQRHRANTIATPLSSDYHPHRGCVASLLQPSQHSTPELMARQQNEYSSYSAEEDSPGPLTHKHLSIVSMESGLSFGYDVEKDFNPSHPLESQPWYHGKITRADAEALLHDDGDFLVRENTTMVNTYTLTLRWRGVADHTLIGTTEVISTTLFIRGAAVKYQFDSGAFDSVPELIYNHLKYQIPVDVAQHTLIVNPVCRPGNPVRGGMYMGGYAPALFHRSNLSPESSPSYSGTGSRHSGSPSELPRLRLAKSISTSTARDSASLPRERLSKHLSASSGDLLEASTKVDFALSPRNVISPPPDSRGRDSRGRAMTISYTSLRQSGSSIGSEAGQLGPTVHSGSQAGNHQRVDSFGDYEVMESVSILNDSPTLSTHTPHPPPEGEGHPQQPSARTPRTSQEGRELLKPLEYSRAQSVSAGNSLNRPPRRDSRERVKYAEIRYPRDGGPGVIINPRSSSGNYAEVRFPRSNTISVPSQPPHPFPEYDIVPPGRREATPPYKQEAPYQSRADVLAHRLPDEPTYSIPNPSANVRRTSAHPVSNYATIQFPVRTSAPSTHGHASSTNSSPLHGHTSNTLGRQSSTPNSGIPAPQLVTSQVPIKQTDTTLYAHPNKSRSKASPKSRTKAQQSPKSRTKSREQSPKNTKSRTLDAKTRELSSSNDSLLSSTSGSHSTSPAPKHVIGSSLVHSHATSAKVHKELPGYEALVKVHTILQNHSNDELAYHMTRTDAVCFMLAPRPAEDKDIWKER